MVAPDCVLTFVSRAFGFLNFIFWTPFFDLDGPGGRPRRFGSGRPALGSTGFTLLSSVIAFSLSFEAGFRTDLSIYDFTGSYRK